MVYRKEGKYTLFDMIDSFDFNMVTIYNGTHINSTILSTNCSTEIAI